MAKKQHSFAEAERLFVVEQLGMAEIAARIKVSERTLSDWSNEGDWRQKRASYLSGKQSFHEELYGFGRKLMASIQDDIDNGEKPDQGRLFTLAKILPLITKVKDYEAAVGAKKEDKPQGLTDDILKEIEERILGR